VLSLGYLWYTVRFSRIAFGAGAGVDSGAGDSGMGGDAHRMCQPARDLLRASVIYLPLLLAAMMLDARGRLLF
jgi:protoheme IX farnesyltransferase